MPETYLKRILDARIYDLAVETPLDAAPLISRRLQNNVQLKREDLQPVFSFKIRGAYNKLRLLDAEQRKRGVIAASAGNHAQGLAMAAKHIGCKATIVMPTTTPQIKADAVQRLGAKVVLKGDTYDEAAAYAEKLCEQKRLTPIAPYDDVDVIAGQGTIAMEILRQQPGQLDAIFIPVGGGGLCAGMAAYIKSLRPEIQVIAVEAEESACLQAAMKAGRRVQLSQVGIFADGVAVAKVGKENWRILKQCVDACITVNTDEICAAIKDIFDDTRSIAEPSGALALAGLKKYTQQTQCKDQHLIAVVSGANANFDRLGYISERTEIGEKREAIFAVTIPEEAGSYRKFCAMLGKRAITEFNYRYADKKKAHIFLGLKMNPHTDDRKQLVAKLQKQGYELIDMTDNEMAKIHIRHMVGGHAPFTENEVLYRFEFPERPGALLEFLTRLAGNWNISLFHYRNHGSAFGRVLVGLQIPQQQRGKFEALLKELNYNYWNETENAAYRCFLA